MDEVFITGLSARGVIGVRDWERKKPQEIRIDLSLFSDQRKAGESDDLADCIDYSEIARQVQAHAECAQRFTVEALAADIARICLENTHVQRVRVRVAKPGAVRFTQSVGVQIERSRESAS